ncbi:MAG: hypothetical protein U9M89_00920 [Patescibacteria group bacterium]|nr:hypothetical protein [Patescibacteria group bacterium]
MSRLYKEAGIEDLTPYKYDMSKEFPTYYDHEKEERAEKQHHENRNRN